MEHLATYFSEISIKIQWYSFNKMHLKMSSAKWQPFVSTLMFWTIRVYRFSLQWLCNGRNVVSDDQPHYWLRNHLFRHRSMKTSKLRVTGLCEGNSQVTGEFPAQRASNAENVSIWWRHHVGNSPLSAHSFPDQLWVFWTTVPAGHIVNQAKLIGPWEMWKWFYKCMFQTYFMNW